MKVPALHPQFERDHGARAAHRLFVACANRHGTDITPVAEFLASLYDARRIQVDAYMLCRGTSSDCFEDVLNVMRWFRQTENGFDIQHIVDRDDGDLLIRSLFEKVSH